MQKVFKFDSPENEAPYINITFEIYFPSEFLMRKKRREKMMRRKENIKKKIAIQMIFSIRFNRICDCISFLN